MEPMQTWLYLLLVRPLDPMLCDYVYLDIGGHNLETQNLLVWMRTISRQSLGEIYVASNESNGPESNGSSADVTLTKFVCRLNPMRTRWIR
jgi:hypothetical protein